MENIKNYLYTLSTNGEECLLCMNIPFGKVCYPTQWKCISDLLVSFLNREYFPNIVDMEILKQRGFFPYGIKAQDEVYKCLDAWDHEEVEHTVRAIYGIDDIRVNKLKPNERHCVYLSLAHRPPLAIRQGRSLKLNDNSFESLRSMYDIQPFFDSHIFVEAAMSSGYTFQDLWESIQKEKHIDRSTALYIAGCEIASSHRLKLKKDFQVHFYTTADLVDWMLNYIIERNRYIYRCSECGKYFGSKREDATFCSTDCANKYNASKGKYGIPEVDKIYKLVVSSFRDRLQASNVHGWNYIERGDESFAVVNLKTKKSAFHAEYRNRTKKLKNLILECNQKQFDICANDLLAWLREQLSYVRDLIPDRLAE